MESEAGQPSEGAENLTEGSQFCLWLQGMELWNDGFGGREDLGAYTSASIDHY